MSADTINDQLRNLDQHLRVSSAIVASLLSQKPSALEKSYEAIQTFTSLPLSNNLDFPSSAAASVVPHQKVAGGLPTTSISSQSSVASVPSSDVALQPSAAASAVEQTPAPRKSTFIEKTFAVEIQVLPYDADAILTQCSSQDIAQFYHSNKFIIQKVCSGSHVIYNCYEPMRTENKTIHSQYSLPDQEYVNPGTYFITYSPDFILYNVDDNNYNVFQKVYELDINAMRAAMKEVNEIRQKKQSRFIVRTLPPDEGKTPPGGGARKKRSRMRIRKRKMSCRRHHHRKTKRRP